MKMHRFDTVSFVGGLGMTLVGLLFLLPPRGSDLFDIITDYAAWFWPILLLIAGIAIVTSAIPPRAVSTDDEPGSQERGDAEAKEL